MTDGRGVQTGHPRAAIAMAVSTSALALLAAAVLAARLTQPAYVMPAWVLVVAASCVVLTVIGSAAAARRHRVTPWVAPVITAVLVVASLELLVVALPVALFLLLAITVRALRRRAGTVPTDDGLGAPAFLLTIGLVPLFLLIFLGGPVIECTPGGGGSGVPIWAWFSERGGATSGTISGSGPSDSSASTGTETVGRTTYSWVCHDRTVVQFSTHRQ